MLDNLTERIENNQCPLCKRGAKITIVGHRYIVECKTSGTFEFPDIWLATIKDDDMELLPYLSIQPGKHTSAGSGLN